MGYRIRILGKNLCAVPLKELRKLAHPALLDAGEGVEDDWEALTLKHESGSPIAFIERNPVTEGQLGFDELQEFIEEVSYYKPESASGWLKEYLPGVKVIYCFQLLGGTDVDDGFAVMHRVYGRVWRSAGGILQADQEGFTNEAGCTILWQFDDGVTGPWNAAVLKAEGGWVNFEMDLGNQAQRESFLRGEVPPGVERLPENARLVR